MSITATFEYEPTEHYQASRVVTKLTPLRWVSVACFVVLPVGIIALTAFAANAAGHHVPTALIDVIPYVLLMYFWGALIPWSQRRRAKKLPNIDPSARGLQERRVDVDGFHSRGNGVSLDIPWHALKKVVETEQFFLFFYNWQCAYYLPKRAVRGDELETIRCYSREALGTQAKVANAQLSSVAG